MFKSIEAIYDDGKIKPLKPDELKLKRGKVLLTILEVYDEEDKSYSPTFTKKEAFQLAGSITLNEDPMEYQKRMRNEWE